MYLDLKDLTVKKIYVDLANMAPLKSIVYTEKEIDCNSPILVQGLPGIGFVASIAVLHMVRKLGAVKFGEIYSPYFQDAVFATGEGDVRRPGIEMYFAKSKSRDMILIYGNTQPLTRYGQYEVTGKILDIASSYKCGSLVSFAGLRKERVMGSPKVFCTASCFEMLEKALERDIHPMSGEIYGMAGLLIGLARLREMHGLCLLAETVGALDPRAAKAVLEKFCEIYNVILDLSDLDIAASSLNERLKYPETSRLL
ncbi:MAG: PAC2 family protein [Candidatus Bathyarchaeia archaeon]